MDRKGKIKTKEKVMGVRKLGWHKFSVDADLVVNQSTMHTSLPPSPSSSAPSKSLSKH